MRIGTPLSPSATKVMLLGSGELGKEVIIALERLGVEVIRGRPLRERAGNAGSRRKIGGDRHDEREGAPENS
jgi:phosphoribosylglycinamide formyltransferase 2